MMTTICAQATAEYGPLVAQFGFGGAVLFILVRWLDSVTKWMERIDNRMERSDHTMRGLSKALWMDLASRPNADSIIKEHAKQMVVRMDSAEREPKRGDRE